MSADLTTLLERAADEAPATRPDLTDGAVRRGTTLRRRRRATQGLASLSVAAVMVGGFAVASGWDGADGAAPEGAQRAPRTCACPTGSPRRLSWSRRDPSTRPWPLHSRRTAPFPG